MSAFHAERAPAALNIRDQVIAAVAHLDHLLPGQAPILNFVHHNTLHGFQHLPFTEAVAAAERLTGNRGYLPEDAFRRFYARGRIDDGDLAASLERNAMRPLDAVLVRAGARSILRGEVWRIGLVYGIEAISSTALRWQMEEHDALGQFQHDVPEATRATLLDRAGCRAREGHAQGAVIRDLWHACLSPWGLSGEPPHPEALVDEAQPGDSDFGDAVILGRMRAETRERLGQAIEAVGSQWTLRGLLLALTGQDVLDEVRPMLIRFCASHLDEGLAAWRSPDRGKGLYRAWRRAASGDLALTLAELPDWRAAFSALPEDPVDAVMAGLRRLTIPESCWTAYLERLALEIPGWCGLVNWRQQRPHYEANRDSPTSLMDFLAMRVFLDTLWVDRVCRATWGIPGTLDAIAAFLGRNLEEFAVREALFSGVLPEHLAARAEALARASHTDAGRREGWRTAASALWSNGHAAAERRGASDVGQRAWRLFRLAQHLALTPGDVSGLCRADAERLLAALDEPSAGERGYIWLWAYERHYRDALFAALTQNHGRGRWAVRETRPEAQVIFCMDDREESIRRHLEELNPAIETLGAAGFFGVPMNWRGLDDSGVTPLCPVVVTPAHEVREVPRPGTEDVCRAHQRRRGLKRFIGRLLNQEIRRNLVTSKLLIDLLAPGYLAVLAGKVFFPRHQAALSKAAAAFVPHVPTRLQLTAPPGSPAASPEAPRVGFTDAEQADRVAAFLRVVGLTSGFAPLVVVAGHGSDSQNNPHRAAYDCGACSGRHGGPNARAFAAMANRPEVRALVAQRGIKIPDDTWFLGSEHNTCSEEVLWFDLEDLPAAFAPALGKLRGDLDRALLLSAHERCRRFASAPRNPSFEAAMAHVVGRAADFSQARPELGHATNAAALIGRRSVTRGAFFDRRVFLISYDPTRDGDGTILENILLAAGPVGAGINLEYYFSTVDNDRYGCGSKVPHNVTGLFAVMEGGSSDLRTGLPQQMVEIHEAMRLQVVVETTPEVLSAIYRRQPPLQELIGNGWLLVSTIDPDSGAISVFEPEVGFVPWTDSGGPLPAVARSTDWYAGHGEPRPPALIGACLEREADHAG